MSERFDLATVQAAGLRRLGFSDVFTYTGDEQMPEADRVAMDEYLSHFTRLEKNACPGCGSPLSGTMIDQVLGIATFTWGIAHGEGHCSKCFYPARAYHFNVGSITRFELILPWHPDELIPRAKQDYAESAGVEP